ncbi:hypothetical protein B0J17DRAFT_659643 [Rhizoctonia solani]|nr:hypothetical protein B0J17DRAFT_659643 [Rhizoctonia solani]
MQGGGASAQAWALRSLLLGIRCPTCTVPQELLLPPWYTTMYSFRWQSYRSLLFLWMLDVGARGASGQQTTATCDKSFDWANNSKGQSPCLVAAYLQGQCFPSKQWNVTFLGSGTHYIAPINQEVTGCAWWNIWIVGEWTVNCPTGLINNGSFPFQVPADTAMPQWALKAISPQSYFDLEAAKGGGSDSLSGATVFLIVLLPILWSRRKRRARRASSRHTIISVDTASDIHIQLTRKSMESLHTQYAYDRHYGQPSPVPTTPESAGYSYSSQPSPSLPSPGAQYAHYPELSGYQPHQPYLVPPSAVTSLGLGQQHHSVTPTQSQPLTRATTQTYTPQIEANHDRRSSEPIVVENDSGTFPRTPVEPQLPILPMSDMQRLLPPSVRANAPRS